MQLKVKWISGWAHVHGTKPDGTRFRQSLKTQDAKRAEELRSQIEADLWRASMYGEGHQATLEDAAKGYAEDGGEARYLARVVEQLGSRPVKAIKPKDIRDAAKRAYPDVKPATMNRQFVTPASAVINWAHDQGWCSPIRVRRFPSPQAKRKAVGLDYLPALQPHMPHRLFVLMLFLQQTGRRVSEAIAIEPDWISGHRVHIPHTKNGEPATAVLPPALAQMMLDLEPRHGRVFGYLGRSSVYKTLRRACAKAGVEYLGTHQPGRHSFATQLLNAGWQSSQIAEAGGWKSVALVAKTYEHPSDVGEAAAAVFDKKLASD